MKTRAFFISLTIALTPAAFAEQPIADVMFLQETVMKIFSGQTLQLNGPIDLAFDSQGTLWIASQAGVFTGQPGGTWTRYPFLETKTYKQSPILVVDRHDRRRLLLVSTHEVGFLRSGTSPHLAHVPNNFGNPTDAVITGREQAVIATDTGLYKIDGQAIEAFPQAPKEAYVAVAAIDKQHIYAATQKALYALEGDRIRRWWVGGQIDRPITALAVTENGTILVGHDEGINLLSSDGLWSRWGIREGIPYRDITCIEAGIGDDIWIGTSKGLIRKRPDGWDYYQGGRWLCANGVANIAIGKNQVFASSEGGIAFIEFGSWTLTLKAEHYEQITTKRHSRHGLISKSLLREPNNLKTSYTIDNDNDGLWTSIYLAAQCFRYAVTDKEEAFDKAKACFATMERLETINGWPGFISRSFLGPGEPVPKSKQWHASKVEQGWYWKGDTSSDEYAGHAFVYPIYYDLIGDENERQKAKALMARILDHILEHNYTLTDIDGKPTRWGVWTPEKLNDDQDWAYERGLNSLQIISALTCAYHMTGDTKYRDCKYELITKHGYAENILNQKMTYPPEENHSDDELAFLPYYGLLKYETDPALKKIWAESLRRSWETQRKEKASLWNIIYGTSGAADFLLEDAIDNLRNWPLDLRTWGVDVAGRTDTLIDPVPDRFGKPQVLQVLPIDERPMAKWNANPYSIGSTQWDAHAEEDGGAYLLPYWMARYHGFIK